MTKAAVRAMDTAQAVCQSHSLPLDEFIVVGIPTTIEFHQKVVESDAFVEGDVYTDFVEKHMS